MDLKIYFYRDKDSKQSFAETPRLHVGDGVADSSRNLIHFSEGTWGVKGAVSDLMFLEARLEKIAPGEDLDSLYQLQLAYRPDYEPQTDKEGRFFTWGKDGEGKKVTVFRMQMLRGASGPSMLRLRRRTNMTEHFEWDTIAEFDIKVEPNPDKKQLLDRMVDEMIGVNSSAVISTFEGLSRTNIKEEWFSSDTASTLRDVERQIVEFENLIKLLKPHLLDIASRCTGVVVRTYQRVHQGKLRKISPKTRRDMDRRLLLGVSRGRVCAPVLSMSYDVPIHRAIKGFLLYFKNCVVDLIYKIKDSISADEVWLSKVPVVDEFLPKDIKKVIEFKRSLLDKAKEIVGRCQPFFMEGCPWMQCRGVVSGSIDYLATVDIPNTEAYKCAHKMMMDFLKLRDFKGRLNGCFRLPKYVRDSDDGECSTWQKNYSFIYEAWVFKRLVQAFMNVGFKELETNYLQQIEQSIKNIYLGPVINNPICAEMKQNDSSLRVKLYHGIIAYPDGTYSLRDFSARHRNKKGRETPDYAIVFYGKDPAKKPYWVVLDAKSWMKLGIDTMKARDKYLNAVRLHGEKPNQSWIIYSGPKNGFAEIEFDPDDQNHDNWPWTDELKDEEPLVGNAGVTFTRYGLSGENTEGQYVGHVRANVNTIKECDVFSVFAEGLIAIATKVLNEV
jgi:hypothetical protein